ncbi:hypothetical protein [Pleionea sp. CnH1-48]|uniref:hypothetical protein n=1 Tax=Pleionea sp. CnH1-48 TaxID=2954494 RepID=UPI0020982DB6|nr:hypothetical protein [Pleionea sp. CnH1-48]MCO7224144.1 hypothetical protein [Pleionea sp. CnH1-48]
MKLSDSTLGAYSLRYMSLSGYSLRLLISIIFFQKLSYALDDPLVKLSTIEEAASLKVGYGYLLVDLDVGGTGPSIEFVRLKTGDKLYLGQKQKYAVKGDKKLIRLSQDKQGFYVTQLQEGLYQITKINAPYFDLPYKLSTDRDRRWRFSVEAGKVNYIGKLVIKKKRSTKYVGVDLVSRIATDKDRIKSLLTKLPEQVLLRHGTGFRDDFYSTFIDENKE